MPAFLVPLAAWLLKFLSDRSFAIGLAAFFVASATAAIAAVAALMARVSLTMPEDVARFCSWVAPRDAAAQITLILTARAMVIASRIFLASIKMGGAK